MASTYNAPVKSSRTDLGRYLGVISGILNRRWAQPTLRETGGERPTAGVQLIIHADGRVASGRLTRPSGNAAMDASVRQLLGSVRRLPPPRGYGIREHKLTVKINFKLDL